MTRTANQVEIACEYPYTFNGPAGSSTSIFFRPRAISAQDFGSATLLVRVDSGASMPAGSTVLIELFNASITDEDPSTIFLGATALTSITISAGDPLPHLYQASATGIGVSVAVRMTVTYTSTGGQVTFTAGIDLLQRERTSGKFSFLDPTLGTCALWLAASDPTTMFTDTSMGTQSTNGANVGRWKDKSGNAEHCDQTGAGKPTLNTTGLNSLPTVAFVAGSTQKLVSPTFSIPQPCTIYIVGFATNGGATPVYLDGQTANTRAMYDEGTTDFTILGSVAGTPTLSQTIGSAATPHVFCAVFNSTSSVNRVDAAEVTGDAGNSGLTTGLYIGSDGTTNYVSGGISAVLVYLTNHSAAQRATVQAALKAIWATP